MGSFDLTPEQSQYVLEYLTKRKVVTPAQIRQALNSLNAEISSLEGRLSSLRSIKAQQARPKVSAKAKKPQKAATARKTGRPLTAAQKASRVAQGRYLGLYRLAGSRERARAKKIAANEGRGAAITFLEKAKKK